MYAYTQALEKLFIELGGKINYSSPVEIIFR
jgi:phytoene dehydrogenase-like protein